MIHDLPVVNAILNGTAGLLLIIGYTFIRRGKVNAHHNVMLTAFIVSCLFLISYLVYHYNVGSVKFDKPGWVRTAYLWILATHTDTCRDCARSRHHHLDSRIERAIRKTSRHREMDAADLAICQRDRCDRLLTSLSGQTTTLVTRFDSATPVRTIVRVSKRGRFRAGPWIDGR